MRKLGALVMLVLVFLVSSGVSAAVFTVNTTSDAHDASPGNGVCMTASGQCSVRAAIEEANQLGGIHTVVIPAGTFVLTLGELQLEVELTLDGAGVSQTTLDGGSVSTLIEVMSSGIVEVDDMTLRHGSGGAVRNNSGGTLYLNSVTVSDNHAAGESGGAVQNFGFANIVDAVFVANSADRGGAIFNNGSLNLTDVVFSDNEALVSDGGALYNAGGGTSNLTGVTIYDNSAAQYGGGICDDAASGMTLTNVTISSNNAVAGGAAIALGSAATVTFINVTVANNPAGGGGGAIHLISGLGTVSLSNTLIAFNTPVNCSGALLLVSSQGHNLDSADTCGLDGPGDLINTSPVLGPLGYHGGPTPTIVLRSDSAGIDDGDDSLAPSFDQRGVPRPQDGDSDGLAVSDIGATELRPPIFEDDFESGNTANWSGVVP